MWIEFPQNTVTGLKVNKDLYIYTYIIDVCMYMLRCSIMSDSAWTVAHQGSSAHGIFKAKILEWIAFSYSGGSSLPRD